MRESQVHVSPTARSQLGDSRMSESSKTEPDITQLLIDWSHGDKLAVEELMPVVVEELRGIAKHHFSREAPGHTLQPTALVNEAYLRLRRHTKIDFKSRAQFFALAAHLMRHILVDHARAHRRLKRGQGVTKIALDESIEVPFRQDLDLVALDDALKSLASFDARQSKIVELRFFGGLKVEEAAGVLGVSTATIKREWRIAKIWLYRELRR